MCTQASGNMKHNDHWHSYRGTWLRTMNERQFPRPSNISSYQEDHVALSPRRTKIESTRGNEPSTTAEAAQADDGVFPRFNRLVPCDLCGHERCYTVLKLDRESCQDLECDRSSRISLHYVRLNIPWNQKCPHGTPVDGIHQEQQPERLDLNKRVMSVDSSMSSSWNVDASSKQQSSTRHSNSTDVLESSLGPTQAIEASMDTPFEPKRDQKAYVTSEDTISSNGSMGLATLLKRSGSAIHPIATDIDDNQMQIPEDFDRHVVSNESEMDVLTGLMGHLCSSNETNDHHVVHDIRQESWGEDSDADVVQKRQKDLPKEAEPEVDIKQQLNDLLGAMNTSSDSEDLT